MGARKFLNARFRCRSTAEAGRLRNSKALFIKILQGCYLREETEHPYQRLALSTPPANLANFPFWSVRRATGLRSEHSELFAQLEKILKAPDRYAPFRDSCFESAIGLTEVTALHAEPALTLQGAQLGKQFRRGVGVDFPESKLPHPGRIHQSTAAGEG